MQGGHKAHWWVKTLTTAYRRCSRADKNAFLDRLRHF